ncbi:MAG: hypothetical protein FD132_2917, partial [bacterium]
MFQQFQLIRDLSVLDNVMLPAVPTGRAHADIHARALRLLDEVGLGQRAAARVQWLSGGEAQRAAIARALINDPSVILADEPTAHLDSALSRQILEILAELRRRGRTLVIASHDPLVFEMDLVERVVDLRDGRVLTVHGLSTVSPAGCEGGMLCIPNSPLAPLAGEGSFESRCRDLHGKVIFQPAALALLLASSLNALGLAAAGLFALRMLRHWNPDVGSEAQIALERRTHLVSTLVVLSLLLSLPMLALFTHTADAMAPFFAGAMCAVGSLKANAWGLPALAVMLAGFFLAAAWLVLHRLDTRGWDQPLLLAKYRLLLLLAPLALAQAALLWLYFGGLKAEVITSCCGSLFGPAATGALAELSALPETIARPLFFLT